MRKLYTKHLNRKINPITERVNMLRKKYEQEYFSTPVEPGPLRDFALEYHRKTEDFDRRRCRCRNKRGIALPLSVEERADCNSNALKVRRDLIRKNGLNAKDFDKEVRNTVEIFEKTLALGLGTVSYKS